MLSVCGLLFKTQSRSWQTKKKKKEKKYKAEKDASIDTNGTCGCADSFVGHLMVDKTHTDSRAYLHDQNSFPISVSSMLFSSL